MESTHCYIYGCFVNFCSRLKSVPLLVWRQEKHCVSITRHFGKNVVFEYFKMQNQDWRWKMLNLIRVKKKPKLNIFQPTPKCFTTKQLNSGFSHSSFLFLRLAHFSQVSIAPGQTRWFIVAIHLLYSSITSRLLGNHGSSCLLLSSTEGPSVSGGRWKALRTRCCHTK